MPARRSRGRVPRSRWRASPWIRLRNDRPDTGESTRRRHTGRASRPVDQSAARTVDRIEPARRDGTIDDASEITCRDRGPDPSARSLDRPPALRSATAAGTGLDRGAASRPKTCASPPIHPRDLVQVHDVRVLCENTSRSQSSVLPIVLRRKGRRRADLDHVVGNRLRPSVREIRLIDEDDVDAPDWPSELGRDTVGCLLRDRCKPAGERLFALMKVDRELAVCDRTETQPGIVPAGRARRIDGAGKTKEAATRALTSVIEPELLPARRDRRPSGR